MVLVGENRAVSSKLRTGRAVKTGFPPQLSWRHVQLAMWSIFIKSGLSDQVCFKSFDANISQFVSLGDSSLLFGWVNFVNLRFSWLPVLIVCSTKQEAPKMLIHCWSSEEEVQAASTKATWLAPGSLVALGGFPEVCFDGNTVMHNSPPSKDLAASFQNASYLLQWNSKMRELHTYQKKVSSTAAVMQKTVSY